MIDVRIFPTPQPYGEIFPKMQAYTQLRTASTPDALWLLEHTPVFTQGQAGKAEHILDPHDIPVVQSDRGGQVTYHGPGQLMVYTLFDLKRLDLNIRPFVQKLESSIILLLEDFGIKGELQPGAPGVYVSGAKICSLGLRIRKGFAYHGLAFNIDMDLIPFQYINPCGFKQLKMTQLKDYVPTITFAQAREQLTRHLLNQFTSTKESLS
jgi:lipoyl(octanoyl) transferase